MSVSNSLNYNNLASSAANKARWFSENEDRAWAENFFLFYSPIWMVLMAIMMVTGWVNKFNDVELLVHGALVALPLGIIPALLRRGKNPENAWYKSYWFKANLYMFVFGFFGNYFGSEYFFDVLGMVYNMPMATTVLDAKLVGHSGQTVPLIMYFYTHAYFMTYHTTAILVLRRLMTSGLPGSTIFFMPAIFVIGYFWAWMETKAMANPLMTTTFYYKNIPAMLAYGSIIYATYFVASFPIFYFLDEKATARWDFFKTAAAGLSASMLTFYLLDVCAYMVGSI